jgi:hypothetical protein
VPAPVAPCTASELTVTQMRGPAGADNYFWWYILTNSGSATCTLKGAPIISTKDNDTGAAGPALTVAYSTASKTAPAVSLGSGQQASFEVDDSPGCSLAPARLTRTQ